MESAAGHRPVIVQHEIVDLTERGLSHHELRDHLQEYFVMKDPLVAMSTTHRASIVCEGLWVLKGALAPTVASTAMTIRSSTFAQLALMTEATELTCSTNHSTAARTPPTHLEHITGSL